MKAVAIEEFGAPDVLQLMEFPEPECRVDHVLIKTRAPHFNSISNYLDSENTTTAIKHLITVSSLPYGAKSTIWRKLLHLYLYHREEFNAHYYKRSNVESTFPVICFSILFCFRCLIPRNTICSTELLCLTQ